MMPLDRMPSISVGVIVPRGAFYDGHHHWWSSDGGLNALVRFEVGGYVTHTVRTTPDRRFFFRHVLGHRAFERTDWAIARSSL